MMAANLNNHLGPSSRQHPHLPSHLAPLPPLEPSDRHHPYHLSAASAGRRGSTDPILHASLAASASANVGGSHHGSSGLSASSLSSPSPFDAPRRRSIQIEPTMPSSHPSPFASPSHSGLHSSRFMSQTNSPAPHHNHHNDDGPSSLPPLAGSSHPDDGPRHAQVQSNYQFGSYSTPPNPESLYRHEDAKSHHSHSRVPTVSAPDGEGGGSMIETPLHDPGSRRGSAVSLAGKLLVPDKDAKPYSRSPELRVSHKLAERKRRKEMKELFDDLRDQLPVDKGPKTSKWEILSKAVEHIAQIQKEKDDLAAQVEALRSQLGNAEPRAKNGYAINGSSHLRGHDDSHYHGGYRA